jgi:hypothetical protein
LAFPLRSFVVRFLGHIYPARESIDQKKPSFGGFFWSFAFRRSAFEAAGSKVGSKSDPRGLAGTGPPSRRSISRRISARKPLTNFRSISEDSKN